MRHGGVRFVFLVAVGMSMFGWGCAGPTRGPRSKLAQVAGTGFSKEDIADLLNQFQDTFEAAVRQAADRLVAASPDRRTRRLTLLWQTRVIPMARDALDQDDALHGLLDAWVLCARMRDFFQDGEGRDLFGEHQLIAQEAAAQCLDRVESIAALILSPHAVHDAREAVNDLARKFPLRGDFGGLPVRTAVEKPDKYPDVLASILTVPIAPFRAFEGIDRGAAAIKGFTAVAARMTDVVNDLPESARLQTELLMMDVEELETVQSALASFSELSRSSARVAAVAESLPQDLRRELIQAIDELDSRQAGVQRTLADARDVADRLHAVLERVENAAGPVEQLAAQTARAGEAWTGTFQSLAETVRILKEPRAAPDDSPDQDGAASPTPSTPDTVEQAFDVNDWTRTMEALDRAALQLQQLTRDVRDLAGSSELADALRQLEQRLENLVTAARRGALGVADRAAWRAAQLILLIFLLALAYRAFTRLRPLRESR